MAMTDDVIAIVSDESDSDLILLRAEDAGQVLGHGDCSWSGLWKEDSPITRCKATG